MKFLITGLGSFIIIFAYYYIFIISNKKKNKEQMLPKEAQILVNLYKLDVKKIGYKRLLWHIAITNSLGVGLVMMATEFFDSIWLKAGIAVGLVILLVLGINFMLGTIYKKRGWTK